MASASEVNAGYSTIRSSMAYSKPDEADKQYFKSFNVHAGLPVHTEMRPTET